jgi:hypothetical protein
MANFSTFTSDHLANILRNPQNFKTTIFPDFTPGNYTLVPAVSLITQGVNLDSLVENGTNNLLLPNEVPINGTTLYVRKSSFNGVNAADFTWSSIFNDSSNPTLPPGVVAPSDKNGYSFFYNSTEILWGIPAGSNWGTITHYAYVAHAQFDTSPPGGITDLRAFRRVLAWGALTSPKTVNQNDIFRFPIGALQINVY